MAKKHIVSLKPEERSEVEAIIKKGSNAAKIRRSHILLGADASEGVNR